VNGQQGDLFVFHDNDQSRQAPDALAMISIPAAVAAVIPAMQSFGDRNEMSMRKSTGFQ